MLIASIGPPGPLRLVLLKIFPNIFCLAGWATTQQPKNNFLVLSSLDIVIENTRACNGRLSPTFYQIITGLNFAENFKINQQFTSLQTPFLPRKRPSFQMQIVDTSLIFKTQLVDLEVSASKSQKSKFCKAQWANSAPFFSQLGTGENQPKRICKRGEICFLFVQTNTSLCKTLQTTS